MPVYSFVCGKCRNDFDITCAYSEYRSTKHACPGCGSSEVERDFGKVSVDSFLRGEGWPGKLIKESTYRKKRSVAMDQRMRQNHASPKLTPNVGGEVVDSWEDAAKLAKARGIKDSKPFERLSAEAKQEKRRPRGVVKKAF